MIQPKQKPQQMMMMMNRTTTNTTVMRCYYWLDGNYTGIIQLQRNRWFGDWQRNLRCEKCPTEFLTTSANHPFRWYCYHRRWKYYYSNSATAATTTSRTTFRTPPAVVAAFDTAHFDMHPTMITPHILDMTNVQFTTKPSSVLTCMSAVLTAGVMMMMVMTMTLNPQSCQCNGYTSNENKKKNSDEESDNDDDPTDHNFDGDEHIIDHTPTTTTATKPKKSSAMDGMRKKHPMVGRTIDTLTHSISSIIGTGSGDDDDDDDDGNNSRDASNKSNREFEFQELMKTISNTISSSSSSSEPHGATRLKTWMDQMVDNSPNNNNNGNTTTTNQQQQQSLQQLAQYVFNIAKARYQHDNGDDVDRGSNSNSNKYPIASNLTQTVADLLAAIQQQNRPLRSTISSKKIDTDDHVLLQQQQRLEDNSTIFDLLSLLHTYSDDVHALVSKHMSNIDYQRITPTAILYYGEHADGRYESILQERVRQLATTEGDGDINSYNPFAILFRNLQLHQQERLMDYFNVKHTDTTDTTTTATAKAKNQNSDTTTTTAAVATTNIDPSILQIIERHPDAMDLVQLAYADTTNDIQVGLQQLSSSTSSTHCYQYELIHCNLQSEPGKPAHYCAIRTEQPSSPPPLDSSTTTSSTDSAHDSVTATTLNVVVVIRGTKTVADAITDLLCDTEPYNHWGKAGKAHSYILDSGRYIAKYYQSIFYDLLNNNNNNNTNNTCKISKINVTIYGHSLGAGAGAIAAMELHGLNDDRIQVQMVGYGCPAILSKPLAEQTSDYITTFINDSDLVPRLSGISLTNLLYDIIEFDWMPYAQRDVQSVFQDLQQWQPMIFNTDTITTMTNIINPIIEKMHHDTYVAPSEHAIPRSHVELYPPGKCIHIYHDGHDRRSACYVPNWFYSKIDVNKQMLVDHLLPASGGYIEAIAEIQCTGQPQRKELNNPTV